MVDIIVFHTLEYQMTRLRNKFPPGYSTFGLYYPNPHMWHAVIIFNFHGHIGYIDPQISKDKFFLRKLSPEIRETVKIVFEITGTDEENNVVGIEDIDYKKSWNYDWHTTIPDLGI